MSSTEVHDGSTSDLIGGLITDVKDLAVAHGERMKLEVRDELRGLKATLKLVGIAVGVITVAATLAGQAIALGLVAATGLPVWAGYGIVAVVAGIVAAVVLSRRPPAEQIDLIPENAMRAAKSDAQMVASAVQS